MRVRRPEATDRLGWDRLYAGYAGFYGVTQTPIMRDRVWSWINDPAHETEAFVAEGDSGLVGLAHFRAFARPLSATTGGFLDDLFVSPGARGTGAAEALIHAVAEEGRQRGWSVIRWITAGDNARARKLYDRLARATPWVTYDLTP
ncbi:GNAT family N-acetyltransferase [Rubellimicrobium rubrum]|uniref:GNAT family N-acetyltransferase n=1 Tax=Rubellimicrobium rubrum TaxID=2585369 RepID=A0A5C4N3Y7_9RHOB|nr:GNAT family N-acetyltransferase [Rubellimicrobium rubrum]TNC52966.1 GNAT family N-acetyltransferase [Rubellimicrobium rubrum]